MSTRVGGIYVDLGLNEARFQEGLRGAQRGLGKFKTTTETMLSGIAKNFGAGMLSGLVAGGGVTGTLAALRQMAKSIATIGDEAAKAGVSVKVFQEWKYVAEQARIPVDAMTDAFKELNIRADEFVATGKGSAAEAFARLGLSREDVQAKLRDPADLLLTIIERTRKLGNTAAATRIFDEMLGGTGAEQMVRLLQQGEDAIRDQIKAANDMGAVLDREIIRKADEVDKKFNQIATTISTKVKSAIVDSVSALSLFIDGFREIDARQTATLKDQLAAKERQMAGYKDPSNWFSTPEGIIDVTQKEIDRLRVELRDRTLAGMRGQLQTLAEGTGIATKGDKPGYVPPLPEPDKTPTRRANAAAAKTETDAVIALIAQLEEELRLVGATDLERETATMLRQAGADATANQKAQIVSLVSALHAEEQALQRNTELLQEMGAIASSVLKGIASDLLDGKSGAEALGNALDNIADRLISMAIDQGIQMVLGALSGGMGGLLGRSGFPAAPSLGGGLYDKGGYTGPGGKNEPAGVVHRGEYVFSKAAVQRAGVGNLEALHRSLRGYADGGLVTPAVIGMPSMPNMSEFGSAVSRRTADGARGDGTVNINVNVTGANGDQHVVELVRQGVRQGIREYDSGRQARMVRDFYDSRKRGAI